MDRLKERLALSHQALRTFQDALREPATAMNRDASIQRFEYTHEAVWKAAQLYLRVKEKLELASPAAVTRACFQAAILSNEQAKIALQMAQDRNLTVHTYNESLAMEIYARLPKYAEVMEQWLAALSAKAGEEA